MPKKFWQFRNQAADSAELLLYGDISDSSWWGDEVTPKTFADELNALGPLTSLTVRINSGGGDVFAAQTMQQGANASGVNSVGSAPAPTGGEKPDEFMDAIKGLGKKQ